MALKEYCTLGWPIVASFLIEELAKVGQCRLCEAAGAEITGSANMQTFRGFRQMGENYPDIDLLCVRSQGMSITGKRLRELRIEKDMSQEKVAKILGISRTAYNKYESGVIKPVRKLKELSTLFGVSTDYILGEEDLMSRASARDQESVRKYMSLSGTGKYMVNIMLDAVYERENRSWYEDQ